MRPELKPCPFCGGDAIPDPAQLHGLSFVVCAVCGAEGPVSAGDDDAVENWNKRTPLT